MPSFLYLSCRCRVSGLAGLIHSLRLKDGRVVDSVVVEREKSIFINVHPSLLDVFSQSWLAEMAVEGYRIYYGGKRVVPVLVDDAAIPLTWIMFSDDESDKIGLFLKTVLGEEDK